MKYRQFIFEDYNFNQDSKVLTLSYRLDDSLAFSETYKFDFDFTSYDPAVLDQALQGLFIMAGISYYKTYLPPEIVINKGRLDKKDADFFAKTYQKGLSEFFYTNNLDPNTSIHFPDNLDSLQPANTNLRDGQLIAIGGGKDSLVSAELLRDQPRVATWSVGHRSLLEPLVKQIGLNHLWVDRTWDKQLLELNQKDAYNGHIPISAIFACVGVVVAILSGYRDVVVSNESSASESSLTYHRVPINHQYSKSFAFEKYKDVFSSCNRAFTHDSSNLYWCGVCPKCAFTFLALTPFISKDKLESLWGGKNLLLDPALEPTYKQLLGIEGDKPLECVGEIKEARAAMNLAKKQYPELEKYRNDITGDYDYT